MLKFFRKYNKIILVIGATFLMVAFLIQGTIGMFLGDGGEQTLGTVDGEEITNFQATSAASVFSTAGSHSPPGASSGRRWSLR